MIELKEVSFSYDENSPYVLQDINLNIQPGEWLTVIGPNGSGKSTLARLLNGLHLPNKGVVLVDGLDTAKEDDLWRLRQRVAFVFQNPDNQIVATSVEDDVAFGPENLGLPRQEIAHRVEQALEITGLQDFRDKSPHLLSGGEKQRLGIAGALAMSAQYLVLDEPTSMLDPALRKQVVNILQLLHHDYHLGIILITNLIEEAVLGERVILLNQGGIVAEGTPQAIFSDPKKLREAHLDVPQISHLANLLADDGFSDLRGSLQLDELLKKLLKL